MSPNPHIRGKDIIHTNIFPTCTTHHVCMCVTTSYISVHTHTHTHTYTNILTHTQVHTYSLTHTHILTRAHTHTHTHQHTQTKKTKIMVRRETTVKQGERESKRVTQEMERGSEERAYVCMSCNINEH